MRPINDEVLNPAYLNGEGNVEVSSDDRSDSIVGKEYIDSRRSARVEFCNE